MKTLFDGLHFCGADISRNGRRRGSFVSRSAWVLSLVAVIGAATLGSHAADTAPAGNDLRGILPATVPADLSDAIEALPASWKPWGAELSANLGTLFGGQADAAGQRQAIAGLRTKLKTIRNSIADASYHMMTEQLVGLHGSLKRRADVVEAMLDTLEASGGAKTAQSGSEVAKPVSFVAANPALRQNLTALAAAIESYEANRSSSAAGAVRKSFDDVRRSAGNDGARITDAVTSSYLNYNMRMVVSEKFLNRFMAQKRNDEGPVDDCILGAKVDGCQVTMTDVGVDLQSSPNTVRFDITLTGVTNSNTQGVTEQATIFTQGNHYFWAAKQIDFNGDTFATGPARISVNANNTTTGATTQFSDVPLLGKIAEGIAVGAAKRKRPQSEAIAASRVEDRVVPELDSEVNKEFEMSNQNMESRVIGPFKELGLYPDARAFSTTDDRMLASTRLMHASELGGSRPLRTSASDDGATIYVHDSLLNNAIDHMNVAGKTMTEDELKTLIEQRISKLLGKPTKLPASSKSDEADNSPKTLVFAKEDPIRLHAANNQLILTLRTGFKTKDGDEIPTQVISTPINFSVQGDNLILERGNIEVSAAVKPEGAGVAKQIANAGVIRKKIETALPRREIDRHTVVTRDRLKLTVSLAAVKSVDGWLVFWLN